MGNTDIVNTVRSAIMCVSLKRIGYNATDVKDESCLHDAKFDVKVLVSTRFPRKSVKT